MDGPSCQETPDVRRRGDAVQDIREQRLGGGDRWSCQLLVISCTPVTLHFEDGLLGVLSLRAQKEEGLVPLAPLQRRIVTLGRCVLEESVHGDEAVIPLRNHLSKVIINVDYRRRDDVNLHAEAKASPFAAKKCGGHWSPTVRRCEGLGRCECHEGVDEALPDTFPVSFKNICIFSRKFP